MTIGSDEAAAMLADVETVVARVKQSRVYRNAALIIILWGAVDLVRDLLIAVEPAWFAPRWFLADAAGVVGTIALLRFGAAPAGRFPLRILAAFALFYAFGWIWSQLLGQFGPREEMAFWPTLFLFGYTLAGFGSARRSRPSASASPPSSSSAMSGRAKRFFSGRLLSPASASCSAGFGCGGPDRWRDPTTSSTSPCGSA